MANIQMYIGPPTASVTFGGSAKTLASMQSSPPAGVSIGAIAGSTLLVAALRTDLTGALTSPTGLTDAGTVTAYSPTDVNTRLAAAVATAVTDIASALEM